MYQKINQFKLMGLIVIVCAFFFVGASVSHAATITVDTTTGAAGVDTFCNLEEAIDSFNGGSDSGECIADLTNPYGTDDTIEFGIGVSNDTQVITDIDAEYVITSPILIDGPTQGNASCGLLDDLSDRDLDIQLNGIKLTFQAGSDGSRIQGISILGGEDYSAIQISDVDGFDLLCSNIGIDADGTSANGTRSDLIAINDSANITIGSDTLNIQATNIIAGGNEVSYAASVVATNVDDFAVYGNWFGFGVGPTFNEFPATGESIDIWCPTECGLAADYSSNITIVGNTFNGGETADNALSLWGVGTLLVEDNIFEDMSVVGIGLQELGSDITIRDNTFDGNDTAEVGIELESVDDVTIEDNSITGFSIEAIEVAEASNVDVLDNHIFENLRSGIVLDAVDTGTVTGNYVGTDETGTTARGNGTAVPDGGPNAGISILGSSDIIVGGDEVSERNIVSGNDSVFFTAGIAAVASDSITIQGNYIGVAADGVTALSNGSNSAGVGIASDEVIVGGTASAEANIIQGGQNGVSITTFGGPVAVRYMAVLGNNIYNTSGVGIDIAYDSDLDFVPDTLLGANPNDAGDVDTGPYVGIDASNNLNELLNYPEFTSTETPEGSSTTDIEFILDVPAGDYRIEFFQNSSLEDYGPGETFLDFLNITHTGSGEETFSTTLDVTTGDYIAATATERGLATFSTFGATSEFSASATITALVEEVATRRRSSSTAASRAIATKAFNEYYEGADTPSNNNGGDDDGGSASTDGICSLDKILTQNMRRGAVDGQFHSFTNAIVKDVATLQGYINGILADAYKNPAGPKDGFFGPLTEQGVMRMQRALIERYNLNLGTYGPEGNGVDGLVGPMTIAGINDWCKELAVE